MDLLHNALKWVSYNRGVATARAASLVVGAVLVGLPACGFFDGKVNSVITGDASTASEIRAEAKGQINVLLDEHARLVSQVRENEEKVSRIAADANEEMEEADAITQQNLDNFDFVLNNVMSVPWVQGAIATLGFGGIADSLGRRADSRRKDKRIKLLKNPQENSGESGNA